MAANGIVKSASFFAEGFGFSIGLLGILIVGLGNALPETYFAIVSARRGETGMILGDLMGSVIIPTTLVLGLVALIEPIVIPNFSPFAVARAFVVISSVFFFLFVRSGRKISEKEGIFLVILYIAFWVTEIAVNKLIVF